MTTKDYLEIKEKYVERYGETRPSDFQLMRGPHKNPENFLGLTLLANGEGHLFGGDGAVFSFKEKYSDSDYRVFENHLRNRLSHKISFRAGSNILEAFFPTCYEDYKEFFTAITDLALYFSGRGPCLRLQAEHRAHKRGLDWRDNDTVCLMENEIFEESKK